MVQVVSTLMLAVVGGVIGYKLGVPAGALLGSMVAVAAAGLLGAKTDMPQSYNVIAQMVLGGFLGLTVTQDVLIDIKTHLFASLMVVAVLSVFAVATGYLVSRLTGVELYTALLGSAPGGMPDIVALSQSYEVDHAAVIVMQSVRRILIVMIYPILVMVISRLSNIR